MASCKCSSSDGYDEERFEKEVDTKLHCPICFKVLNEPMQCANQHYFCRFCIEKHIEENSETCPMCQHHLTQETLTKAPRILEQFLSSLKIQCDYAKQGCTVSVELQFLSKHVKDCDFKPTPCGNSGCTDVLNRCDIKKHEEELCSFRSWMVCEECAEEVLEKFTGIHPCMMKRSLDSLTAKINILQNEMSELKSVQKDFITEALNMIASFKAANEDATSNLTDEINTLVAEAVKESIKKMKDEMEMKQTDAEEIACLKRELEQTKTKVTTVSEQLELKEANILRPELDAQCRNKEIEVENSAKTAGLSIWEIKKNTLTFTNKVASTEFGEVWQGLWNSSRPVAIKTLRARTKRPEEFLEEAEIMKKLIHPKLLVLYGVCSLEEPICIVTEFMTKGTLLEFLRAKGRRLLDIQKMVDIAMQVAEGMTFLESHGVVHRDLAARNVLVGDGLVVKIAGFRLARVLVEGVFEAPDGERCYPVKWTALEACLEDKFSTKSDVWSFGIFLTEITTCGRIPYPGMSNTEVLKKIRDSGYRMPKPAQAPDELYAIMLDCWSAVPEERPTFETLYRRLKHF